MEKAPLKESSLTVSDSDSEFEQVVQRSLPKFDYEEF